MRSIHLAWLLAGILAPQFSIAQVNAVLKQYSSGPMGSFRGSVATEGLPEVRLSAGSARELFHDGLPTKSIKALSGIKADKVFATRSAKDAQLYKLASPAVVLVVTNDGLGSGSLISKTGEILTNWHVVHGAREVGVIFKPAIEGKKISRVDVRRANIVRVDEISDLALLSVAEVPPNHEPLRLGDPSDVSIGSDVHAIGHPTGEAWTYTKGVISQYRQGYEWRTDDDPAAKHKADVIQTQTPINPGNSGGPLLSNSGLLIGVNAFKAQGEALNFAVAVDSVREFLIRRSSRYAERENPPAIPSAQAGNQCEPKQLYHGKTKDGKGEITVWDTECSGHADMEMIVSNDKTEPIIVRLDRNHDRKADVLVLDFDRDGKWDLSYWDEDFDGNWDLVGFHPDGNLQPSKYETYASFRARLATRR